MTDQAPAGATRTQVTAAGVPHRAGRATPHCLSGALAGPAVEQSRGSCTHSLFSQHICTEHLLCAGPGAENRTTGPCPRGLAWSRGEPVSARQTERLWVAVCAAGKGPPAFTGWQENLGAGDMKLSPKGREGPLQRPDMPSRGRRAAQGALRASSERQRLCDNNEAGPQGWLAQFCAFRARAWAGCPLAEQKQGRGVPGASRHADGRLWGQ